MLTTPAYAATNTQLIDRFCRTNYPGKQVKIINQEKLSYNTFTHRKGKVVYVIKFRTKSRGTYGYTSNGNYIRYNKYVSKGKTHYTYYIYSPYTNYEDDVVARVDSNKIKIMR